MAFKLFEVFEVLLRSIFGLMLKYPLLVLLNFVKDVQEFRGQPAFVVWELENSLDFFESRLDLQNLKMHHLKSEHGYDLFEVFDINGFLALHNPHKNMVDLA